MWWRDVRACLFPCAVGLGVAGFGCSSDADGAGGAAGADGTGGTGSTRNIYVNQVQGGNCLPRPLDVDAEGRVDCEFVEVRPKATSPCACDDTQGRLAVGEPIVVETNLQEYMHNVGFCGASGTPACEDYCYCELRQFSGAELLTCESAATDPGTQYGYCYVDPLLDVNSDGTPDANPALVADCPASSKRRLRFMGAGLPAPDALLMLAFLSNPTVE